MACFWTATASRPGSRDTDAQLKARDVLQQAMGGIIVALNLLSSTPEWLTVCIPPDVPGLDLRGGVHFLLQIDMKAAMDKSMERYAGDIRRDLRDKEDSFWPGAPYWHDAGDEIPRQEVPARLPAT